MILTILHALLRDVAMGFSPFVLEEVGQTFIYGVSVKGH